MTPVILGALLNSALYLACCFVAGFAEHNAYAWRLALAAMGVSFLSYLYQLYLPEPHEDHRRAQRAISVFSIALGAIAGMALLF